MARQSKAAADDKTVEGIPHDHGDGDTHHIHRLGNIDHSHVDGKAVFPDPDGRPSFTDNGQDLRGGRLRDAKGRFRSKLDAPKLDATQARKLRAEAATIVLRRADLITVDALLAEHDQRLAFVDDLADRAIERISLEPGLVALAVERFDHEVAAFEAASERLQDEVLVRSRFLVFAAAAQHRGHHPAAAYCYVADRLDPAGVAS